jgi:hypothetical protein
MLSSGCDCYAEPLVMHVVLNINCNVEMANLHKTIHICNIHEMNNV